MLLADRSIHKEVQLNSSLYSQFNNGIIQPPHTILRAVKPYSQPEFCIVLISLRNRNMNIKSRSLELRVNTGLIYIYIWFVMSARIVVSLTLFWYERKLVWIYWERRVDQCSRWMHYICSLRLLFFQEAFKKKAGEMCIICALGLCVNVHTLIG